MNAQYDPGSEQVRPAALQSSHAAPAMPQALFAVPARQVPALSQQPPHVDALHTGGAPTHLPPVQAEPTVEHTEHV